MSISFSEISLVFESLSQFFSCPLPTFPEIYMLPPLPKAVSLHCTLPLVLLPLPLLIIIAQSLTLRSRARWGMKALVICARSKENFSVLSIYYDVNISTKSKTGSRFSRVFFGEIP